jgi:hypothetical protein
VSPGALLTAALVLTASSPTVPGGLADAALAGRGEEEFRRGVSRRDAGDKARPYFRAAAADFEGLWRRGVHNADLARDLGNAYLLADDLSHAILSYRRGLLLDPGDRALREALAQARELVVYPQGSRLGRPPVERRPPWLPALRPGWVFAGAALSYALAWVAVTRWLMLRRGRLLAGAVGTFVAAGALAALFAVLARAERQERDHPPVVIAEDGVLLRRGDNLAFPPRYETPVNRGVEGRLLFEREGWLQIELAGGEVGWVPQAYALVGRE